MSILFSRTLTFAYTVVVFHTWSCITIILPFRLLTVESDVRKLLKNCLEKVNSVREQLSECSSDNGVTQVET